MLTLNALTMKVLVSYKPVQLHMEYSTTPSTAYHNTLCMVTTATLLNHYFATLSLQAHRSSASLQGPPGWSYRWDAARVQSPSNCASAGQMAPGRTQGSSDAENSTRRMACILFHTIASLRCTKKLHCAQKPQQQMSITLQQYIMPKDLSHICITH